jgi:hypothetical protein
MANPGFPLWIFTMVGSNLDNPTKKKNTVTNALAYFAGTTMEKERKVLLSLTPPNSTILILVSRYPFSLYPPFPGLKATIFFSKKLEKMKN